MSTQCNVMPQGYNQVEATLSEAPRSSVSRFLRYWQKRRQHRIDRLAFKQLLRLDDELLKDIGLTRADVIWADSLPVSTDASSELEAIARRTGN